MLPRGSTRGISSANGRQAREARATAFLARPGAADPRGMSDGGMDEIGNILLALNVRGWQTGCAGGRREVVHWARHRQTGEVLTSRAPASHAEDAARWLAERYKADVDKV